MTETKRKAQKIRPKMLAISIWLLTSLVLTSHAWLADGLSGQGIFKSVRDGGIKQLVVDSYNDWTIFAIAISFLLFSGLSYLLFRLTAAAFRPVHDIRAREDIKGKALIFTISLVREPIKLDLELSPAILFGHGNSEAKLKLNDLDEDINAVTEAGIRWSWQQVLRGLKPHINSVEKIYPVFTREKKLDKDNQVTYEGSYVHEAQFKQWLENYIDPTKTKIVICQSKYVDQTKLGECYDHYNDVIDLAKDAGYSEDEIIVDITGGTAILSSASSFATLHNKTKIQHVRPDNSGDVKFYDMGLHFNRPPF